VRLSSQLVTRAPHRGDDQVPLPQARGLLALAAELDREPAARHPGLDLVVARQREPERVVTRSQVGAGRGNPHHYGGLYPVHPAPLAVPGRGAARCQPCVSPIEVCPIRPARARPRRWPRPPELSPARARRRPPSPDPSDRCRGSYRRPRNRRQAARSPGPAAPPRPPPRPPT